MAMDLCIDEKDEERESEAQSHVRAKKHAGGEPRSLFLVNKRSLAISLSMFCVVNGRFEKTRLRTCLLYTSDAADE